MFGLKSRPVRRVEPAADYRLAAAIQRSEHAFLTAQAAENRGDYSVAEHFLEVAIREEANAFPQT